MVDRNGTFLLMKVPTPWPALCLQSLSHKIEGCRSGVDLLEEGVGSMGLTGD
jgi:hypothetical protein